jgi:hypothetical protein
MDRTNETTKARRTADRELRESVSSAVLELSFVLERVPDIDAIAYQMIRTTQTKLKDALANANSVLDAEAFGEPINPQEG